MTSHEGTARAARERGGATGAAPLPREGGKPPLYWRVLHLRHIRPNGWQRAVLVEGVLAVAVTLVLADVASAWTLIVLPLASALMVKAHDVLTGVLRRPLSHAGLPR